MLKVQALGKQSTVAAAYLEGQSVNSFDNINDSIMVDK